MNRIAIQYKKVTLLLILAFCLFEIQKLHILLELTFLFTLAFKYFDLWFIKWSVAKLHLQLELKI
jgi:hypothetical protein